MRCTSSSPGLAAAVAGVAAQAAECGAQELANTVWAMATVQLRDQSVLEVVQHAALQLEGPREAAGGATPRSGVAATAGEAARMGGEAARADPRAGAGGGGTAADGAISLALSALAWGLASNGVEEPRIIQALAGKLLHGEVSSQQAAVAAWAVAAVGGDPGVAARLGARALEGGLAELAPQSVWQLHQVALAAEIAGVPFVSGEAGEQLEALAVEATAETQSSMQAQMLAALRVSYPATREEVSVRGLLLDAALPDLRLGVEMDGPFHFVNDTEYNLASRFKQRLVEGLGWTVVRIAHFDWTRLPRDQHASYARERVEGALRASPRRPPPPPPPPR